MHRLLLAAALLCGGADAARPAPPAYVTPNYGVRLALPPGLSYCPLPADWVGTDHGPMLYLRRPDCRDPKGRRIGVDYEHNVAEHDYGGPEDRPARTDAELRRTDCPSLRPAVPVRLLGRRVLPCVEVAGGWLTVTAAAVYDIERDGTEPPGFTLAVRLVTTPRYLAADLAAFRRVVAGASICTPRWAKRAPGRRPCREFAGSWW